MRRDLADETAERMLRRYQDGLLTREELEDYLELQRRRSEIMERALQAGRAPGRALAEREDA